MQPRFDDALIVAETCLKLDPYNGQVIDLVNRLKGYRDSQGEFEKMRSNLQQMESQVRSNPTDYQAAFNLASTYASMQQTAQAMQVLDRVLNDPNADANVLRALLQAFAGMSNPARVQMVVAKLEAMVATNPANIRAVVGIAEGYRNMQQPERALQVLDRAFGEAKEPNAMLEIAQGYAQLGNYPKLEATLERLVEMLPGEAEPYYDLAALKAGLGKSADALKYLSRAIEISDARRATNAAAKNLAASARTDDRFVMLRTLPEFQKIVATK
jgi:tetratricopeptide (TPR) repeat protein